MSSLKHRTVSGVKWQMVNKIAQSEAEATRLFKCLLAIIGFLAVMHVVALSAEEWSWQIVRLFSLDREANIPTWFSSVLLLLNAVWSYQCSRSSRSVSQKRTWLAMMFIFILMSCDEITSFHENVQVSLQHRFHWSLFKILPAASWPVLLGPFIAGVVFFMSLRLKECLKNSNVAFRYLVLGTGLYLLGAVGFEPTINYLLREGHARLTLFKILYQLENFLEETFEMIGALTIMMGLYEYQQYLKSLIAGRQSLAGSSSEVAP